MESNWCHAGEEPGDISQYRVINPTTARLNGTKAIDRIVMKFYMNTVILMQEVTCRKILMDI